MNFKGLINSVKGAFQPGGRFGKLISPVPDQAGLSGAVARTFYNEQENKNPQPTPTPQVQSPQNFDELSGRIRAGLSKWGRGTEPPVATLSGQLADAGSSMPDPYMPAIMSLIESRGLQDKIPQANANPYNIFYPGSQTPVDYQGNPGVAVTGGDLNGENKLGFKGLLRQGGMYQDYLDSGNLEDFFGRYSPPSGGNAPMEEQIARYNQLRQYFE